MSFPTLAGYLFGGRDVTWFSAAYNWFALVALVSAVALSEFGVIAARVGQLVRRRRVKYRTEANRRSPGHATFRQQRLEHSST